MQQTIAELLPRGGVVSNPARIGKDGNGRIYCSFAAGVDTDITWTIPVVPEYFQGSGTISLRGAFYTTATSGNVRLSVALEALADGTNTGTSTFDTANYVTSPVPVTAGLLREFIITISNSDSLAPEQMARVRLVRLGTDGADTCSATIYLLGCELNEDVNSITVNELVLTNPLGIDNGGTGATDSADAINALLPDQTGNDGYVLQSQGGVAGWTPLGNLATASAPLDVSLGGTGVSSLTGGRILFGNGTSALSTNANLTFNSGSNNFVLNGFQVITNQVASTIPFRITGAASQSGLLTDWRNSSNTSLASVSSTGGITGASLTSTSTIAGVSQTITNTAAGTVPLSVQHAATPTSDFFNVKDSTGAKVFAVSSDKTLLLPPAATIGNAQSLTWKTDGTQWGLAELHIQRASSSNNGIGTQLKLTDNGVSAYIKFFSRSFTQAVNDLEFWSQGGLNISMPYTGGTYIYNPVTNTQYPALLTAPAQTIAVGGGAPSPIGAFVFESVTYGATSANSVTDSASLLIKSAPTQGTNMTLTNRYGGLIITGSAAAKGLAIRGASSQAGNLFEAQDSGSTILMRITSNGAIQPASMADSSAANGTIYYSTTQSKLCYKDASSVVNALY